MRVRPAAPSDMPQMRQWMDRASAAPAWSEHDLASALSASEAAGRRRRAWMVEDEAGAVGFLIVSAVVTNQGVAECEIEFAMVQPDARRRGAGRTLVREAAEWAERMGAKELWLEVRESNEAARRLYAACGFAVTGRRRGYYADPAEDALLMRLALGR